MQPSDEIKQRLDIVDTIRDYMQLKAAGMNFTARCPFHQEKSPSFMVSPDKQIWHCFGCGKGGDVISFVQEMEGLSFIEALRLLAPKAGVTLQKFDPSVNTQRNKSLDVLEMASKFYNHVLLNEKAAVKAREYILERGLTQDTIDEWQIGYAPDTWDTLYKFLKSRNFHDNDMVSAGLVAQKQGGRGFYDRFRDRIMFPISDVNGNVVGFSGRINPGKEETEKMGKYINSPQSDVYDKSRILFGLDKARTDIKREDLAIVVEGQMDVITAHQHGFKNVVASSGTALTAEQIKLIKRYTKNIALSFDMDKAGEMAAERAMKAALNAEMNTKAITLPEGKDPDDLIKKDPDAWKKSVVNARHVVEYFIENSIKKININDVGEKVKVLGRILPVLKMIENKVEQDHWVKKLSQMTGTTEERIREEINNSKTVVRENNEPLAEVVSQVVEETREEKISKMVLSLIIKFSDLFEYLFSKINKEEIIGKNNVSLYKFLTIFYNNRTSNSLAESETIEFNYFNIRQWLQEEADGSLILYFDELAILADKNFNNLSIEDAKNELISLTSNLKKLYIQARMKEIEREMNLLESQGKNNEVEKLFQEFKILSDELRNFK